MTDTDPALTLQRIRHAFTIAPGLARHIVAQRGARGSVDGPRVQTTKVPPAPVNVSAVDDADYVYLALAHWTERLAGKFLEPAPPIIRTARRVQGMVAGFPSTITIDTAYRATRILAKWMLDHLDVTAALHPSELEDLALEARHLLDLTNTWPVEDGGKQQQTPCPHHDRTVPVVVYPPLEPFMPQVIVCDESHYFDEIAWARAEQEHQAKRKQDAIDRRRASRMMNDLTRRYANPPLSRNPDV